MGRQKSPAPVIDKCSPLEKRLQCKTHPKVGALQDHLYSGEYDPFRNAAIFESDFVQVTSKGEVLNIHNHVTVVTVGVTSTSPNYTLPNVMLLARPLNVTSNEICTCKSMDKCSMELTRLFPLSFVRISIHDVYHRRLRLKLANGRSFYLQLYVHPQCENEIFERWMKLVGLLNDSPDEVYGYDDVSPEIEDVLDNVSQATLSELSDWQLEPPEMSPGMREYYEESLKSTGSKKSKKGKDKSKKKDSKKKLTQKSVKGSGNKSGVKKTSGTSKTTASKRSGSKKTLDGKKSKSPPPRQSPSRHTASDTEDQSWSQLRGRRETIGGGDQAVSRGSALRADSSGRGDSSYSASPNVRISPSGSWLDRMDNRSVLQQEIKKDKEKGAKKHDAKSKEKLAKQEKAKKEESKSKDKIKMKDEERNKNEKKLEREKSFERDKSRKEQDKKKLKEKEKEDKKKKEMEAKRIEKEKKQKEKEKKDLEKKQKEKEKKQKEKGDKKKPKLTSKERKRLTLEEKSKDEAKDKSKDKKIYSAASSNEKIDGKDMDEAVQELRYKVEKILEDEQD